MKSRAALWSGVVVAALLLAGGVYWRPSRPPPAAIGARAPVATPAGITLQQRAGKRSRRPVATELVLADADGMTLYRNGSRSPAAASCTGECERTWLPVLAAGGATAAGDWALAARAGGAHQWVYRGAPLYRYRGDTTIGETQGESVEDGTWQAAIFRAEAGLTLPGDIAVREIAAAGGWGLVEASGLTLYGYRGAGLLAAPACEHDRDCAGRWMPLAAPAIATAVGGFTVIARDDGISQWAYQGEALYTFDQDLKAGDANGSGVRPDVRVALVLRQFMPANAMIRRSVELGNILATTGGATLYQRDRVNPDESHDLRGDRGTPALGRAYGTATCDADCARLRPPFVAPTDALPSGFWSIVARADGSRQWTYKGFALYTFAGEQPGELRGNESYEIAQVGDDAAAELAATGRRTPRATGAGATIDPLLPFGAQAVGLGVSALYWRVVAP